MSNAYDLELRTPCPTDYEPRPVIEGKLLRHCYNYDCPDCTEMEFPCASHRSACESCGASEALHAVGFHRCKLDRAERRIIEYWCSGCDPEPEECPPTLRNTGEELNPDMSKVLDEEPEWCRK